MKKHTNILAFIMLGIMFLILIMSSLNDSATFDEIAHIGAGYTYLRYKDSRLNPEHPPLMKDLAALPLVFLNLNFDITQPFWNSENVNDRQWTAGNLLLYGSGNDPDKIVFWARLPIILLAILFGWLLYRWARSLYGEKVGLIVLFLYAFSPTFLAHSRYVTTDVAAAFGFFIGLASFLRFLERTDAKRTAVAGICLGVALLLKFSLFLLLPIYAGLALLWIFFEARENSYNFKFAWPLIGKIVLIGIIALLIIWAVYIYHVWNYPQAEQLRDETWVMSTFGKRYLVNIDTRLIENKYLRPIGQYFLGLLMVIQRADGGNTTYFMGEVSASGWREYFPVAYVLKETIAFHILSIFALFLALRRVIRAKGKNLSSFFDWMRDNFVLTSCIAFILVYWIYSLTSILNIGIRHVLPTFPFIYLLVARELTAWIYRPDSDSPQDLKDWLRVIYKKIFEPIPKIIFLALMFLWIFGSVILVYPYYLSYYNEFIGIDNGYKYIGDSNYDWGQDLKRLRDLVQNNPDFAGKKIYLNYFGGGSPQYYLGRQYEDWWSAKGAPPSGSYFAVSSTLLAGAQGKPIKGIAIKPEDSYSWLSGEVPVARAGKSILIYKIH
ncbi:hypothetical protein A3I27_01980 [Candidatus Giovannonibacteria bacterium RIFCSPLOWO2_02_FULL_43_11b]|uniref:Glycosyltransferase RgtA/B/C/D-like domain-containing protein n=1 Tax=Candidatus Giovannonibacteria bacterium RIFCSPHIGHO2_12_FULL_43_15 TaxID=1798341 RepID=A0A1F5WQQ0_9BACT|nr:MAG: hypothetical protein A2739_01980 [Candidatus Giovannonibacteria bacterium RIFCSPHIGHO2_01_FULL_43_100]OGF67843.1 MAG: hypothetical protein A3B97_01010 [Candidatus Giovannonibacteria bacterium RIFCSPHIGHO2_02_FULL_43_32]OGF78003.1 MAG: hypothetical protein A3F23_03365 [Candidatus Giovannonibacteria bacterium RIFCSPHIGHO2_12_FULL_43_15]OGF79524.1 MAG: hypothetical protein A3A15_02230 [Candidatus Giovannonibacteria bacterium RIFCSPLOWO2_01_FULL_43_60]OGF89253.1 MAG: hypothetical protein A3